MLGDGEWVMNNRKMPVADYEKLPPPFNPAEFDAAEWVALAKAAGMKYITITSKHHDGFAMFDSKVSDWNIVDAHAVQEGRPQAAGRRVPQAGHQAVLLLLAARLAPSRLLSRAAAPARTRDGPSSGDWDKYLDYMDAQLRELLTNYGEIGGIWFDGWWDRPDADWHLDRTYELIHSCSRRR